MDSGIRLSGFNSQLLEPLSLCYPEQVTCLICKMKRLIILMSHKVETFPGS